MGDRSTRLAIESFDWNRLLKEINIDSVMSRERERKGNMNEKKAICSSVNEATSIKRKSINNQTIWNVKCLAA